MENDKENTKIDRDVKRKINRIKKDKTRPRGNHKYLCSVSKCIGNSNKICTRCIPNLGTRLHKKECIINELKHDV